MDETAEVIANFSLHLNSTADEVDKSIATVSLEKVKNSSSLLSTEKKKFVESCEADHRDEPSDLKQPAEQNVDTNASIDRASLSSIGKLKESRTRL